MKKAKWISVPLIAALLAVPVYADGKENAPSKKYDPQRQTEISLTDQNKNKLFDNLEEKMKGMKDEDKVDVIIQFDSKKLSEKGSKALDKAVGSFKINHEYTIFDGIAASLSKKQLAKLEKIPFIKTAELDVEVKTTMSTANQWFGTDKARNDFGLNGDRDGNSSVYSKNDITVAVIDTGIDAAHKDLDNGKVIGFKDFVNNRTTAYDDQGHGTHVAGIIAGEGEVTSANKGVAPGSSLVGIKVLDANGSGSMSNVTAGIDWAVQNKDVYGIRILNLSLGTSQSSDGTDSTSVAVNNAVNAGLVVAVAAGNSGPARYTIGSPGAADKAITVGAAADLGENGFFLAEFSSRGYTADNRIKPDIVAPGYNITAPQANTSTGYVTYSGTSMATPFTAGTIALMLDANPNLTPSQIASKLYSTAIDFGTSGKDIDYGNGRLDGYEAIKSAGGFTGTNITVPNHLFTSDSLAGSGKADEFSLNVNTTTYPIALTTIMPNWTSSWFSSSPDFDVYVYNPSGTLVAKAEGTKRQETISFKPTVTGTYKIRVSSYSGSGNYFFDVSAGATSLTRTLNQ
ncbi:S8 family serine peptidase [Fictibacillus nanhaiensis]|uniref:S8 family serine peptidase n=1 Tax=Fictibacillus nanhaiensis TaxID=742169 RepID=UPI001C93D596|nr:S8 family serine peptidase [Fictibacillus nanhaiensis]MBY6035041.1 S8 family serine peptidase [Fictibacillus nanhaiensis]